MRVDERLCELEKKEKGFSSLAETFWRKKVRNHTRIPCRTAVVRLAASSGPERPERTRAAPRRGVGGSGRAAGLELGRESRDLGLEVGDSGSRGARRMQQRGGGRGGARGPDRSKKLVLGLGPLGLEGARVESSGGVFFGGNPDDAREGCVDRRSLEQVSHVNGLVRSRADQRGRQGIPGVGQGLEVSPRAGRGLLGAGGVEGSAGRGGGGGRGGGRDVGNRLEGLGPRESGRGSRVLRGGLRERRGLEE